MVLFQSKNVARVFILLLLALLYSNTTYYLLRNTDTNLRARPLYFILYTLNLNPRVSLNFQGLAPRVKMSVHLHGVTSG